MGFLFVHFFKQLNTFVPLDSIPFYIFLEELNVENQEPKLRLLMLLFRFRCCNANSANSSANISLPKHLEI